ncbi:MAG: T9SS type A sorting domain-containing protein [Candidatus Kapaibacterium sp.]|nr:T9SS type A sorting domain-containing protein [Bacteroidota bacterium]
MKRSFTNNTRTLALHEHAASSSSSERWILATIVAILSAVLFSVSAFSQSWVSEAQSNGYTLKKVVSDTTIATGQNFSYTVYFSFPAGANTITITDVLPAGVVFQALSVTSGCGTPVTTTPAVGTNGTVTLAWASVPGGCSGSFVVTVNFPNGTTCNGTAARNRVCLSGNVGSGVKADFCTGFVTTVAQAVNPWNIGKWVSGAAYVGGSCPYATGDSVITYQICVYKNVGTTGQLNLANAVVRDTLPAGAYLQSSTCGATQSGNVITWSIGNLSALPAYNSACCSFSVVYPPSIFPANSSVQNQAYVSGVLGSANQPCGQVNMASNQTCVQLKPVTSATLSKYVYTNTQPGCAGQYLIYMCNNGTTTIPSFTVRDTVPTTLTGYSLGANSGGVTATLAGGIVTITSTSALSPGQCRYVYINFTIPLTATVGSTITNCAWMVTGTTPPVTYQACASFVVTAPAAKPCVWKEVCSKKTAYNPGDTVRYRLRIQNIGGTAITGASITDNLNNNLQYLGNASYYTGVAWNAPCQTSSNWSGVVFSQSGSTLTFTLPSIAATCQNMFYGNCGMYGTGGVPYYFIEFDVKIVDTAALGNIPNYFTIGGGNITTPVNSNTDYVNVVGTIGFNVSKSVAKDTTAWATTTTTTVGSNVNYRLRLTVSPGSVGLRHITFADLLPRDNGASDQLILPPCSPRGSMFDVSYVSTVVTTPLASGYNNPLSFARVNNFIPAGAPGAMFSASCGTAGTWATGIPASSKNPGWYFGSTAVGAGNSATSIFTVAVPANAQNQQNACNTFAANGAVRHLIQSNLISDVPAGQIESATACITIEKPKPCIDSVRVKVECAGTDGSGNQQYTITFTGVNNNGPAMFALNSPQGSFAPSTFTIPAGAFSVTSTFTDTPPVNSMITIYFGIMGPNGQVICRDSILRDLPPCPHEPPVDKCCEKFIHTFPQTQVKWDAAGNVGLNTVMIAGPSPIKRFSATIVSAQRRTVCGNNAGAWERIFGDVTGGSLTVAPGAGPQLLNTYSRRAQWGQDSCVDWNKGAFLKLNMLFPQPACKPCRDTLRFAIQYSFTDCECKTCDTIVYYTVVRTRNCIIFPWDWTDVTRKGINATGKGTSLQSTEAEATTFSMSDANNGKLHIVNPKADAGEGVTINAIQVTSEVVGLNNLANNGNNGLMLGNTGYITFTLLSGNTTDVSFEFDNTNAVMQFPVQVRYIYTVDGSNEQQTSNPVTYMARVPGGKADEMQHDANTKPQNVRTYAVYFTNSNSYKQTVHAITLRPISNTQILAVGPASNKGESTTIVPKKNENGEYTIAAYNTTNSGVEANETVKPIYITVAGAAGNAEFEFTSLDEQGNAITGGTFALTNPVSSVENIGDAPAMELRAQPNPAQGNTTLMFTLEQATANTTLALYDVQGREVVSIFHNKNMDGGNHVITTDVSTLSAGVYYVTLRTTFGTISQPLTVVR